MDHKMDNLNGSFKCDQCNKFYSSYKSIWNHNKKFHNKCINLTTTNNNLTTTNNNFLTTNNNSDIICNPSKNYRCKYCNKSYNIQQSRWKHEQSCNNKINLLEENIKLKQENELLKKNNQLVPLNNTNNSHNNTKNINNINNGTSNINNGTSNVNNTVNNNNNTVTINKIGTEPIVFKAKDIKMIANDGMNGPITCARQLNFNKNKPQNHSYCITSLDGEYCKAINHETQQPEIVPKKMLLIKYLSQHTVLLHQ